MVFFSFERVAQFNLEWIFSKLDSGFQSLVGFRILSAGFRIPKPRIPDSTSRKFRLKDMYTYFIIRQLLLQAIRCLRLCVDL